MDLYGRFALRSRFAHTDAVLPGEVAVTGSHADCFHRPADRDGGVGPSCVSSRTGYTLVDTDRALAAGVAPCRNCYEPVFEYLARQPDSPVEYRDEEPDLDDVDATDAEALADGGLQSRAGATRPEAPLTTRTKTVLVKSGASKVYHAPATDGTLCGERGGGYRSVQREAVEGHYRPCERCFDL